MRDPALPPIDFLLEASLISLQDLELAALNRRANLSRAILSELDQWVEQSATAMLARWMIEKREELLQVGAIDERNLEEAFERFKQERKTA